MSTPVSPRSAEQALTFKNRGNAAFKEGKFREAAVAFSAAIGKDPANHVLYSNRSAAYLSLGSTAEAVEDANKCVSLRPDWGKGYVRLGSAHFVAKNYEEAIKAYAGGMAVEPANGSLSKGLAQAQAAFAAASAPAAAAVAGAGSGTAGDEVATAGTPAGESPVIIGIDLGTTYSCVGVWQDSHVEIIANSEGNRTTPSCVAFTGEERLIGDAAKQQAASNPTNTVFDAKRLIGQKASDPQVVRDAKHFPFAIVPGEGDKPLLEVEFRGATKRFTPEEISAMVLTKMKQTAETYLGHPIRNAVITVPAYFSDSQRQATKDAGAIAGLVVKRIINEPTAAALAYGLDNKAKESGMKAQVLIFDLGGGTFDVSLLAIEDGIFEVRATAGDTHLGGEDFDNSLVDYVAGDFLRKTRVDMTGNKRAMRRLRTACERAKRTLSTATSVTVEVDSLAEGHDLATVVTRAKFNSLNDAHFRRCLDTVKRVLKDATCSTTEVSEVVLVGGSTRIPRIQELLSEHFGGKELCKTINPDEAVAYGAAVQGAILSNERSMATQSLLLVDVTPLSLGIETTGRIMSTVIKRNTPIPVRKTKQYTTEDDYQDSIDVEVYEGERGSTEGNNLLGKFTIAGIERAKRGVPKIDVTFDLDANGILTVTAMDQATKAKANIVISNSRGRLSGDDIERMLAEAEAMKAADEAHVAKVEAQNELETLAYHIIDQTRSETMESSPQETAAREVQDWIASGAGTTAEDFIKKRKQLEARVGISMGR